MRASYRALAKQFHPDLHPDAPGATPQIRALNAAHETLSDPSRRRAYDRELRARETSRTNPRLGRIERNISQDLSLRIEELLRGASCQIQIRDPAYSEGERYELEVPAGTAPGARFRIPRAEAFGGGFVQVRIRVSPHFRFKARGSDLRCDLRINASRANAGGTETVSGPTGNSLRVQIPPRVGRGEILRIPGEGLPKARGGRGDLLVRITYKPDVRITRSRGA